MKKNTITIIVPAYNAEKYIKKCVDSLINQTKKELEIILINDGSTDETEKVIKTFQDNRIRYYKNTNHGIGYTRNFGIQKATGEYLMFIDSDDYLEKTACEKLYENAKKEESDIVVCDFYRIYEDSTLKEEKLPSFKPTTLKETPSLLLDINLSPWNKLYKSSLIKENKITFVENLKYEDAPFVAIALDKAQRISKVDNFLNYYLIRGNSETTVRDRRTFDILQICDKIRNYFSSKEYMEETINKLLVRIITNYTIQQRNQKDIKIGMTFIDQSFDYLKKYVPDYKNNKYYNDRGFFRRTIEKSKLLSKLYCQMYHLKNTKMK